MSAEIITGRAVLHGVANNGSAITLTGYTTFIYDRLAAKHSFKKNVVDDEGGNTAAKVAFDEKVNIEIDFTPASAIGGTRAQVATALAFPVPLAKVTLSNCKVQNTFGTSTVKFLDGDYSYEGDADMTFTSGQTAKMKIPNLEKFADATQNSSLTTTVVG